jgi:hypothetical protein
MEDIVHANNPADPYAGAPHVREKLKAGLKART